MIQVGQGDILDGQASVTLAGLQCGTGCPLPDCCADHGLAFGDIRVFECLAYVPAAAVIILAAMLQMPADLPG